jgi:hypothetical protein
MGICSFHNMKTQAFSRLCLFLEYLVELYQMHDRDMGSSKLRQFDGLDGALL